MKSTIVIDNKEVFAKYLTGLNRFVNSAEFNIDESGCHVYAIDDSTTNRLLYHTNSVHSNDNLSICISDISKFNKAFQICSRYNDEFNMIYDGPYIKTSNKLILNF